MPTMGEKLAAELERLGGSAKDVALGLGRGAARGMSADLLGLPVDTAANIANLGIAGYGTLKGALGGTDLPEPITEPFGGSKHIGRLMESSGILHPETDSPAEFVGRVVGPGALNAKTIAAVGTRGEQLGRALVEKAAQKAEEHLARTGGIQYVMPKSKSMRDAVTPPEQVEPPTVFPTGSKPAIAPKVTARGPDLNTPEGVAAFKLKYGRNPVSEMTEAERVAEFGPAMAESPDVYATDLRSKKEINVPGGFAPSINRGLSGPAPMTLADQAKISAQAIDYNDLDPATALAIHKRLVQSVDPGPNPSTLELANRLGFGVSSGNAPISKNLVEHAQMRPRSVEEMHEWANYSPVGLGQKMPDKEGANRLNSAVNDAYGVQASGRGGTGVANTASRQYISDLNKMLLEKPEFFVRGPGEKESQYVERLMNQVRGLGAKTGSLGFAMVEPQTSNISAIDRHIADLTREWVKGHPATKGMFEQQMLNAFNLEQPASKQAATYATALKRIGAKAEEIEASKFRDIVSDPTTSVYRLKALGGAVNPNVPPHLQPEKFPFFEPKQLQQIGPMYEEALRQIERGGKPRGIGGFSNQWFDWDHIRSRAEPHAALNPMATEMKRMTPEEYGQVRDAFSKAGGFDTKRQESTGRLKPFKPTKDWRKMIYGQKLADELTALG